MTRKEFIEKMDNTYRSLSTQWEPSWSSYSCDALKKNFGKDLGNDSFYKTPVCTYYRKMFTDITSAFWLTDELLEDRPYNGLQDLRLTMLMFFEQQVLETEAYKDF